MVRSLAVIVCVLMSSSPARAQGPYTLASPVSHLATLFTDLYGPRGLIVDSTATLPGEQPHTAHFTSDFQADFSQFSVAFVSQLVTVPLPSPASGFTYRFDPTLGVFQRTTQSFGPILAERSETIGAGRVSVGFAFQRFAFDTIEDLDLGHVPAVFSHDNASLLGGREDVVTTTTAIDASVSQLTSFASFGITDRIDVSLAVPVIDASLSVLSDASIQRLGTNNPQTHFFLQSEGEVGDRRLFSATGSASGLGDLTIRLKGTVHKSDTQGFAAALDVRLPTGDEMNLLGTGTPGITPFGIWSATYEKLSPHVNVGYTWNGSSVLAGNPATGQSADFADTVGYALGADVSVNPRFTMALDVLGRYFIGAERLVQQEFQALDGRSTFPNITFTKDSFNTLTGSVGLKANMVERLLLDVNLLFALDRHGLRDNVTALVGVEYGF